MVSGCKHEFECDGLTGLAHGTGHQPLYQDGWCRHCMALFRRYVPNGPLIPLGETSDPTGT